MHIIKIDALSNGAHSNQNGASVCPEGFAVIPDGTVLPPTYPFVDITVDSSTMPVVLTMTSNQAAYDAAMEAQAAQSEEPATEDTLLDMAADHEERLCMLELNS